MAAVKISTLPAAGTLSYDGTPITTAQVTAGFDVSAADITAGKLVFTPADNANGTGYAAFDFQVRDNGGTTPRTGVDLDQTPNARTSDLTSVNDAPEGTSNTVTTLEDNAYTFTTA